jgi:Uma2 family endonuclease
VRIPLSTELQLFGDYMTLPLLLDVSNTILKVTPEQFDILCIDNPDLRFEMTEDGDLIVMPPTGGETGKKNVNLILQVGNWNEQTNLGEVFDSSTGYDFTALGGGKGNGKRGKGKGEREKGKGESR